MGSAFDERNWKLENGKIVAANLVRIVPQRSFRDDWVAETARPPRSYGIAPMHAEGDAHVLVPLLESEVVWLGLEPVESNEPVVVTVYPIDECDLEAVPIPTESRVNDSSASSVMCPPSYAVKGLRERGAWRPFGTSDDVEFAIRESILICVHQSEGEQADDADAPHVVGDAVAFLTMLFIEPAQYSERAKCEPVEPLDRGDGYGGWRLP